MDLRRKKESYFKGLTQDGGLHAVKRIATHLGLSYPKNWGSQSACLSNLLVIDRLT